MYWLQDVIIQSLFIYCVTFLTCCQAYPSGAPVKACLNLDPQLNASSSQNPSPYAVSLNVPENGYKSNEAYSLTISKVDSNDPDFRGFLCQVRKVGANEPLGRFSLVENGSVEAVTHCDGCKGSVMTCNSSGPGMNTVTHTNNKTISNYTVQWTAPMKGLGGNVYLHALCTVVQSKTVFWDNLESLTRFKEDIDHVTPKSPVDTTPKSPVDTTPKSPVDTTTKSPVDTTTKSPPKGSAASLITFHFPLLMIALIVHCCFSYMLD